MEVLLVTDELPEARSNDHAAYLSQRTQHGSGNTRSRPTGSPAGQPAQSSESGNGNDRSNEQASAEAGGDPLLATLASAPDIRWLGETGSGGQQASAARAAEAHEQAKSGRGDARELVLHGDPRTGQWLSPDTRASSLAPYLDAWRRKVERIGTLNFPAAARHPGLSGSPVIEVELGRDGTLLSAGIRRSSGHPEIDQAALLILHLASPFTAFPRELARDYDVLRFAYQWDFTESGLGAGAVSTGAPPGP
jgi:protein TonB